MAAAAVVASLASAHTHVFSNSVTVNRAGPSGKYGGRVNSPNLRCQRNREVQVYRVRTGPDVRIGRTRTGPAGGWSLFAPPGLGNNRKVYALIETKVLASTAQHDHTCAVDRSPVRTIPYP